jgi:radical SAM-linked protein
MAMRIPMLIVFSVRGDLCFLSHRETLTMWSRILARSGLPVCYSGGFNPHPRLSIPLPRPVGVESDEEILLVQLEGDCSASDAEGLGRMLPAGCAVQRIELPAMPVRRVPVRADYIFVRGEGLPEDFWLGRLEDCRRQLQSAEPIVQCRQVPGKSGKAVDLREYAEEVSGDSERIRLRCRITPTGTLRPEEMLAWLGIGRMELAGPPQRTQVVWTHN